MRVRIWWASAPPNVDPRIALDETELVRWSRYRRPDDQARFVAGRLLARAAIAAELDCLPGDVHLIVRCRVCGAIDHGKPHLAGTDDLDLSIAHTHERVVVAVAQDCKVGIDVERIRPIGELVESNHGVLRDEEIGALGATMQSERTAAFLTYWARKEALVKATGEGLTVPLDSLLVTPPGAPAELLAGPPSLPPERVVMRDLDAGPGYRACLATLLPSAAGDVLIDIVERHVTVDDLERRWVSSGLTT